MYGRAAVKNDTGEGRVGRGLAADAVPETFT